MPNFCMNELEVTGPSDVVEAFVQRARVTGTLQLGSLFPDKQPYDRLREWGTTCELDPTPDSDGYRVMPGNGVYFSFDTAWTPPLLWLADVAKQYPALNFLLRYGEPGNCEAGQLICRRGLVQEDTTYPEGSDEYNAICGVESDATE